MTEHKRITNRFMRALIDKPEDAGQPVGCPDLDDTHIPQPKRRNGHSKLVWDKKSQTFHSVDPHPEQPNLKIIED